MLLTIFQHEHYRCPTCSTSFECNDIENDWKCTTCKHPVCIYAEDHVCRRHVLNRLKPSELCEGACVVIPGPGFEYIYSVISVTKTNAMYRIPLKGYRVLKAHPDQYFNCVIGGW